MMFFSGNAADDTAKSLRYHLLKAQSTQESFGATKVLLGGVGRRNNLLNNWHPRNLTHDS